MDFKLHVLRADPKRKKLGLCLNSKWGVKGVRKVAIVPEVPARSLIEGLEDVFEGELRDAGVADW